jgi:hypothetical protein
MRVRFGELRAVGAALVLGLGACDASPIVEPIGSELALAPAFARAVVFPGGCCFYDGREVRTVVPPSATPNEGRDNFYGFPGGAAAGQKGVVGVVPGDVGYHGGHWKFHAVTWNVTSYLLTSEDAVLAAAAAGDVTITRVREADFLCPIQP